MSSCYGIGCPWHSDCVSYANVHPETTRGTCITDTGERPDYQPMQVSFKTTPAGELISAYAHSLAHDFTPMQMAALLREAATVLERGAQTEGSTGGGAGTSATSSSMPCTRA